MPDYAIPPAIDAPEVGTYALASWAAHLGTTYVDPSALRNRLSQGTLPDAFQAAALRYPGRVALQISDQVMTHGELDVASEKIAGSLLGLGAGPDRPVMLLAETTLSHVLAYLGALRAGAPVLLAHPSLTAPELKHMAMASSAQILIGSGEGLKTAARASLSGIQEVVGLSETDRDTTPLLLAELNHGEVVAESRINPESPAILAFTSGTTGKPKCAPLSHRNLLASIRGMMWAWKWTDRDHLLHALPISHQHGLGGIHATLIAGSRATLLPKFEPNQLVDTAIDVGATILFAVPTIYQRLLSDVDEGISSLSGLRLATSGSSALSSALAHRYELETGQVPLERYGTTESGLDISNLYHGPRLPGTVGLPLPGIEVVIADGDGRIQRAGDAGEVLIKGPQVFSGYLGLEPSETDTFTHGWFRTGDLGLIDAETGFLRLVGRSKELIVTGGMNVYPREVEEALSGLSNILDLAVVGVPSDRWGEEVVVFVSPAEVNVEEVARRAETALAPYKRPKRIVAVATIPRSELGKPSRAELIEIDRSLPDGSAQCL